MNIHRFFPLILFVLLISTICLVQTVHSAGGYRYYDTFIAAFKSLADSYPTLVTYETVGYTVENRSIILFKIGNPNGGRVYFDGAIHGEESLAGELLYAYTKWLLTSNSPLANRILTRTYTLLIPALDADEYNIVRTNAHHVDLNRNFATNWQYAGSSDPTSWYYRGPSPLSEPESQTVIRVFQTFKPSFYLNLHRGGSILYESSYGNATYYSLLYSKMSSLAREMNVTMYPHQSNSGSGYAISDAAKAGITGYLFELLDWTTNLTLPQIETVLLPKFLPVAAVLSQECECEYEFLFEDSFESGDFGAWDGTFTTSGETATVVSTVSYNGNYGARHETNGYGTVENAYCFKNVPSSPKLYATGSFMVTSSGIMDNDDRFYFITFGAGIEGVAKVGWRKINGVVKWTLIVRDGTNYVTAFSDPSPSLNKWYTVQVGWFKDQIEGYGELFVDGLLACSVTDKNTSAFGDVSQVRFGLAELYYCHSTTAYSDYCKISTGESIVSLPWDVNQDGKVDLFDAVIVCIAYGSTPESPNWDPRADVNSDGTVNLFDAAMLCSHYGERYT